MVMKKFFEHLDRVKERPHHVRRKIAFAAAFAGTAVIALAWFAITLGTGAFAIQGSSFADSTGQGGTGTVASSDGGTSGLAGAAAALPPAPAENKAAHIEIVDAKPATTSASRSEATVIPF